jgi:hypothetical protein
MRPAINSPVFNIREIAKQMLLLEDHLTDNEKYCVDCITKHMMTIEALSEEAISLDVNGQWKSIAQDIARKSRQWITLFIDGDDKYKIAQDVRKKRKYLIGLVSDPRTL